MSSQHFNISTKSKTTAALLPPSRKVETPLNRSRSHSRCSCKKKKRERRARWKELARKVAALVLFFYPDLARKVRAAHVQRVDRKKKGPRADVERRGRKWIRANLIPGSIIGGANHPALRPESQLSRIPGYNLPSAVRESGVCLYTRACTLSRAALLTFPGVLYFRGLNNYARTP